MAIQVSWNFCHVLLINCIELNWIEATVYIYMGKSVNKSIISKIKQHHDIIHSNNYIIFIHRYIHYYYISSKIKQHILYIQTTTVYIIFYYTQIHSRTCMLYGSLVLFPMHITSIDGGASLCLCLIIGVPEINWCPK